MNVYGITYPPELLTNLEVARSLSTSLRGVADLVSRGKLTRLDDLQDLARQCWGRH